MYHVSCYHILYSPRSQALPLLSGESLGMKLMLYHLTLYCYYSPYVLEPLLYGYDYEGVTQLGEF